MHSSPPPGQDRDAPPVPSPEPNRTPEPNRRPEPQPEPESEWELRPEPASERDPEPSPDPDGWWLAAVMNGAFVVLLAGALIRFVDRHPGSGRLPWVIGLSVALTVLQFAGRRPGRQREPLPRRWELARLAALVACWTVVVLLAPSFAWCAVPLIYTSLRSLPTRAAVALVAALAVLVVIAELRLADGTDPNLVLLPPAVATLATAVFVHMRRQTGRQQALIDDLVRTRRELAATERREGTLAERQRLSMEIHDSLAQGLSSQRMLLQAADRIWETAPDAARGHVRTATAVAEQNLAEARRFVHDLAPAALVGQDLDDALRALAAQHSEDSDRSEGSDHSEGSADSEHAPRSRPSALTVRCHVEGAPVPLPDRTRSALLRIAQGALANTAEHAGAAHATLTLTYLDDQVLLDVSDDGRGFDPAAVAATGVRGHGLPAIRARVGQLGGTLSIESAPGEGTVLSVAVPLEALEAAP
ncbi:histidine kinase [Streptomyces sp. NPDC008079]|uniref:sensor histidine kinase n=1 Tax=Streptomyces sp. NPDC008079 TaxID=3364806 RepID=UPI0036E2FEE1